MAGSYRSRELEQLRQELRRELRMFDDVSSPCLISLSLSLSLKRKKISKK